MSPRVRDEEAYEFVPGLRPSRLHKDKMELLFTRVYGPSYSNTSVERLSYSDMELLYAVLQEFFNAPE